MVCDVNDKLQNMSTTYKEDISICANCGKEGSSGNMNTCNKCKMVKYCNAVCKKVHKKKHKKDCEEYIRIATEKHEKLFKQPSPLEDCPICFLQLPYLDPTGKKYMSCCGKNICSGCYHAPVYDNQGNIVAEKKCPFCRTPAPTDEESVERLKKRFEAGDAKAIFNLGCDYRDGTDGHRQDHTKALELFHRAAELGDAKSYGSIGYAYLHGRGVEVDKKKAMYYYELSAIGGNTVARYNLGNDELRAGNMNRAVKHYMIAAGSGLTESLEHIQNLYSNGLATKDDYTKALQLYQTYLGDIKSKQRDEAAAFSNTYRYY